ncbi:hypothetical protein VE04_05582 [Pseudogymnoascus sp. 24MN13]|nr:hypothetical protein VE04_05582 [Pseudogymnoascus sp. 24MN13]
MLDQIFSMYAFCKVSTIALVLAAALPCVAHPQNTHYTNPIIPGWHSDPSCIYVRKESTYFCTTSTFLLYPGIPIYASKDLVSWKLVSNVLNRPSQVPELNNVAWQQGGMYAATLRYREDKFHLVVADLGGVGSNYLFTSSDPYNDKAWNDPVKFALDPGSDADLFWDDDGTAYITVARNGLINQFAFDMETGAMGPLSELWNGTGGVYPEGPHMYKKDGYYYLMIAEGGTEQNHTETIARSRNRLGPWEAYPRNPLLTNRDTDQYFQTVGHADLFQDEDYNWWAVALSTRSGKEWLNYPMGRETVLVPATWGKGEWPVLQPVRGTMQGPLPRVNKNVAGDGAFVNEPDKFNFRPGSSIPKHLSFWRFPNTYSYTVSPRGHPNTLRLTPSSMNITGTADIQPSDPITLIMRRQTDTLFTYGVDFSFDPKLENEETGVTLFLTQLQHIDLGIVNLSSPNSKESSISLRFRVEGVGNYVGPAIEPTTVPVPKAWHGKSIRLEIKAVNTTHYSFSAALSAKPSQSQIIAYAKALLVSGGTGIFTARIANLVVLLLGALVGAYATSNGGNGTTNSYLSNWRYEGQGQEIDYDTIVSSNFF